MLEIETITNNRVSALEGNVTVLSDQLATANAQLSTIGSQVAASISTQVASLRSDIQTQSTVARVDAIESRMAVQASAVPAFAVAGGSSSTSSTQSISAVGQDIILEAPGRGGSVMLSSAECAATDLCELARSVAAITDALRQA